jgi:hypothetical protein
MSSLIDLNDLDPNWKFELVMFFMNKKYANSQVLYPANYI